MNRWLAFLLVVFFWGAMYLPGLGTRPLKGEEGRRILPAVAMLDTGNWLVPHLNGSPYMRKPPLVNWSIAVSLYLTDERNEWTARLPSVLAMLAMAAAIFWTGTRWLSTPAAFAAAVISLSGIGLWEKGRMAEIDAIYSALTGIAFAVWLSAWVNRKTGWKLWLWPVLCLGVAMLAKGPLHLVLFYVVVIPVLIAAGEKRQIWSPAHLLSLGLAALIVAAWGVPYLLWTAALDPASVWANQMNNCLGNGRPGKMAVHEFNSLANMLPWLLFVPLWWSRRVLDGLDERCRLLVRVARWPISLGVMGLVLIVGMVPRYSLPLYPAAALLLAAVLPALQDRARRAWEWCCGGITVVALAGLAFAPWIAKPSVVDGAAFLPLIAFGTACLFLKRQIAASAPARLAVGTALAFAAAVAVYAAAVIPRVNFVCTSDPDDAGMGINAALPSKSVLYVVDPGYEPLFFYVKRPCVFVKDGKDLPPDSHYVLLRQRQSHGIEEIVPGGSEMGAFPGLGKKRLLLVERQIRRPI